MDYNTIILYEKETYLSKYELTYFEKGDLIWGDNANPYELMRWTADDKQEAEAELAKLRCRYDFRYPHMKVEEYALEYCTFDSEGEFISFYDYELAKQDLYNLIDERSDAIRNVIEDTLEEALKWNRIYNVLLYENGDVQSFEIRASECCTPLANNWRKDGFLVATINGEDIKKETNLEDDIYIKDLVDKIMDTAWRNGRSINN